MKWLGVVFLFLLSSCTNIANTATVGSSSTISASSNSAKDSVQIQSRAQLWAWWGVSDSLQTAADSLKILLGIHFQDTTNFAITNEIDSIVSHYQNESMMRAFVESFCDLADTIMLVRRNTSSSVQDAYGVSNTVLTDNIWFISFRGDTLGFSSSQVNQRSFCSEGNGCSTDYTETDQFNCFTKPYQLDYSTRKITGEIFSRLSFHSISDTTRLLNHSAFCNLIALPSERGCASGY